MLRFLKNMTLLPLITILLVFYLLSYWILRKTPIVRLFNLQAKKMEEGFESLCKATMPLQSCWAPELLPQSTDTVTITPTVPLVLPAGSREQCLRQKYSANCIDCTSDLECTYPLKCCGNKCVPPVTVESTRGGDLYTPQRMRICPPCKTNQPCQTSGDCKSKFLTCKDNTCKTKEIVYDGPFYDLQAPCQRVGCACAPYY